MRYRLVFLLVLVLIIVSFFSFTKFKVSAQDLSSSLAIQVPVEGDANPGDIVCSSNTLFTKCNQEYQTAMYGVVVESSTLEIVDSEIENPKLVVTEGIATVKVNNSNGEIKKGSLVTSSGVQGMGQVASKNGYVLGTALEDLTNADSNGYGTVQVVINIHPASGMSKGGGSNLVQFLRDGLSVAVFEPLESFRYLLAGIMIVVAFTLGLAYFGRSSRAGIEAIGRNPLAKSTIQFTTVLNVLLTIVIVGSGLGIAYFILIL